MDIGLVILGVVCVLIEARSLEIGIDRGTTECNPNGDKMKLYVEKGDYGVIESFNASGTGNTSSKHGCSVEIMACSTCKIRIEILQLDFPECQTRKHHKHRHLCISGCDHLQVHEIDQPYAAVTRTNYMAGDEQPDYISISSNVHLKHCKSSGSIAGGRSFRVRYEVVEKRVMRSGTVSSLPFMTSGGQIMSPNYPDGYALNGDTFTYTIQNLDPYGHIRLIFDDWMIADSSKIQIFDGLDMSAPSVQLDSHKRPVLVSESSTLIIVFHTGRMDKKCCHSVGFKATYQFVSDIKWNVKPNTDCGEIITTKSGGKIQISNFNITTPSIFDCVWIIKRPPTTKYTGILLRITEIVKGKGWHEYEENRLDVHDGLSSESEHMAFYTVNNLTSATLVSRSEGFYIRLRAALHRRDNINFVYTLVTNSTEDGCPSSTDYMCNNGWCIDRDLTCDDIDHCGDRSDETQPLCSMSKFLKIDIKWTKPEIPRTTVHPCGHGGIRCPTDNLCIPMFNICDGYLDCQDKSDEIYCAYYQEKAAISISGAETYLIQNNNTLYILKLFLSYTLIYSFFKIYDFMLL